MARILYFAIEEAIRDILKADNNLKDDMVVIEEEPPTNIDLGRWIGIYLERRDPIAGSIAAGKRQRLQMTFAIWCAASHMESVAQACQERDKLMGQVEIALLGDTNKTLNSTVQRFELGGGEFESARIEGGIMMSGSIIINAQQEATT